MNRQDKIQYSAFILGLYDLYLPFSGNTFYINNPCIAIKNKIVKTGKTYGLLYLKEDTIIGFRKVKLKEVNCDLFNIILGVEENDSGEKIDLEFNFLRKEIYDTWRLINFEDLDKNIDDFTSGKYCNRE